MTERVEETLRAVAVCAAAMADALKDGDQVAGALASAGLLDNLAALREQMGECPCGCEPTEQAVTALRMVAGSHDRECSPHLRGAARRALRLGPCEERQDCPMRTACNLCGQEDVLAPQGLGALADPDWEDNEGSERFLEAILGADGESPGQAGVPS